jgi:hypothetical protein
MAPFFCFLKPFFFGADKPYVQAGLKYANYLGFKRGQNQFSDKKQSRR